MYDIIPDFVLQKIRDRYLAGVSDAEATFSDNKGDEDSLTGALGQAISTKVPISIKTDDGLYQYSINYRKLRGRGPNAPEKKFGADGIFQIAVYRGDGKLLRQKGLPFQAKKQWNHADKNLVKQAHKMLHLTGQGLVVDYSPAGYTACSAREVVHANGKKRALKAEGQLHDLGHVLANDFLECKIGAPNLYYDVEREVFTSEQPLQFIPHHAINTIIGIL